MLNSKQLDLWPTESYSPHHRVQLNQKFLYYKGTYQHNVHLLNIFMKNQIGCSMVPSQIPIGIVCPSFDFLAKYFRARYLDVRRAEPVMPNSFGNTQNPYTIVFSQLLSFEIIHNPGCNRKVTNQQWFVQIDWWHCLKHCIPVHSRGRVTHSVRPHLNPKVDFFFWIVITKKLPCTACGKINATFFR